MVSAQDKLVSTSRNLKIRMDGMDGMKPGGVEDFETQNINSYFVRNLYESHTSPIAKLLDPKLRVLFLSIQVLRQKMNTTIL